MRGLTKPTRKPMRQNRNSANHFNLIWVVQSRAEKYSASRFGRSSFIDRLSRTHKRGVRVVTNVGCGMRWTRTTHMTSAPGADGEVVWS